MGHNRGTLLARRALGVSQKFKTGMRDGGRVRNQLCPLDHVRLRSDAGRATCAVFWLTKRKASALPILTAN
jgi:hypothetical protein